MSSLDGPVGRPPVPKAAIRVPWLDLLLAEAPLEALDCHRDELIRGGADPGEVGREVAAALRLKAVLDQQRRRASERAALNEAAAQLASIRQPEELLEAVACWARRLLDADLAYLGLVRDGELMMAATQGALTPRLRELRVPTTAGIAGAVVGQGQPVWSSNYAAEAHFSRHPLADTTTVAEEIHALLGVPLALHGRIIGVLFASRRREHQFTGAEVASLSMLASYAAAAIGTMRTVRCLQRDVERLGTENDELERALLRNRRLAQALLDGGDVDGVLCEVDAEATGDVVFVNARDGVPPDLAERAPELPSLLSALFRDPVTTNAPAHVRAVITGNVPCGALAVLDSEDVTRDGALLDQAAPFVALAVTREAAVADATRLTRDVLLTDLLTRPASGPVPMRQRMRNAGLDPAASYCVLVAEAADDQGQVRREIGSWRLPPGAVLAAHGARLVAVVPAPAPEALLGTRPPGGAATATVGVAGPAVGAEELARCHRDAELTLDALLTLGREGEAASSGQLGLYRVLLSHTGNQELQDQLEQMAGPVLREQERRQVPLLETLRAYLDHGGRATPAARALGIHVNTLYQRLGVVDDLLGPTWREPPRSLDLQLLLRVHPGHSRVGPGGGPARPDPSAG
ncbi:helix-turn-helix domain-containing protein [Streptomyces sp. NPDC002537]